MHLVFCGWLVNGKTAFTICKFRTCFLVEGDFCFEMKTISKSCCGLTGKVKDFPTFSSIVVQINRVDETISPRNFIKIFDPRVGGFFFSKTERSVGD